MDRCISNNLKNEVFKSESSLEALTFVKELGTFVRSKCQENRKLLEKTPMLLNKSTDGEDDFQHSYFGHQDNWKGKIQKRIEKIEIK